MLRFLWHWLFHWMRPWCRYWGQDYTHYYLCKCGKAFKVLFGWREERGWFMDIEKADAEAMRKFREEVRRDIQTL